MSEKVNQPDCSIVIPVYNEEEIVGNAITRLDAFLRGKDIRYEIIAVNDGSSDNSFEELKKLECDSLRIISHPHNRGYGAALKTGVSESIARKVLFYDADGQHKPDEVMRLIVESIDYDMVVGSRQGYQGPGWRQPGKKFINLLANYLVSFKIPDLNSGLRIVTKKKFEQFEHLYPNGFSLSTTITLAFIKHGFTVKYIPITIEPRVGNSSLRITDGFKAIQLVLRMIMLFAPLRIFLPAALLFAIFTGVSVWIDIFVYQFNLSETTLILFVSSVMVFFMGLIADELASLRRELRV